MRWKRRRFGGGGQRVLEGVGRGGQGVLKEGEGAFCFFALGGFESPQLEYAGICSQRELFLLSTTCVHGGPLSQSQRMARISS